MQFDLPPEMEPSLPQWSKGIGSLPVVLEDGRYHKVPIPKGMNILTVGITGSGKSQSFTLPAANTLLAADPQRKAVFFEIKRTFLDAFGQSNDKVIAFDPPPRLKPDLFRWNLIKEIRQARVREAEMRQIAEILFQDLLGKAENNLAWIESARNTFIAVLRVIVDCTEENTTNRNLVSALRMMSIPDLLAYLAKHPRNHSLLSKDFGYDISKKTPYEPTRRAQDIMFFFNSVLELFGGTFASDGQDTIHDYLDGRYGRNLFLLYDLTTAASSRPFLVYFLRKCKDEVMSQSRAEKCPMLWCLDEVDKMADGGKASDFGLYQAATLGREYGLQILLTTQSVENLYGLAPESNAHITQGGLAGFPMLVSFRPGDPTTISTLQTLFGSRWQDIIAYPPNRYSSPVVQHVLVPLVSDYDFATLRTGEAYVKIQNTDPQRVTFLLPEK